MAKIFYRCKAYEELNSFLNTEQGERLVQRWMELLNNYFSKVDPNEKPDDWYYMQIGGEIIRFSGSIEDAESYPGIDVSEYHPWLGVFNPTSYEDAYDHTLRCIKELLKAYMTREGILGESHETVEDEDLEWYAEFFNSLL
jgi:hypothetical protein